MMVSKDSVKMSPGLVLMLTCSSVARCCQIPPEAVSVSELGHILSKKSGDVMRALKRLGEARVTLESMIDPDTAELVAIELGLRTQRLVAKDW